MSDVKRTSAESTEGARELRCLVCAKALGAVEPDGVHPHGGVVFSSPGNYGSTVFEQGFAADTRLVALVCDQCLVERLQRTFVSTPARRLPPSYRVPLSVEDLPE